MERTTYLSSIISALNKLNGMGSLNEIYDVIEKEGRLSYIFSNPNWKDNVRATIQRHCIQTKSYRGSEDLFCSVYGLGEGYWKLKKFDSSEYDNPNNRSTTENDCKFRYFKYRKRNDNKIQSWARNLQR